jgi:hypothetical protein
MYVCACVGLGKPDIIKGCDKLVIFQWKFIFTCRKSQEIYQLVSIIFHSKKIIGEVPLSYLDLGRFSHV